MEEEAPDIKLEYLSIWIHGRERPDSQDYWDGDWLNATARCSAPGSTVSVQGSILHMSELQTWQMDLEVMNRTLRGEANLRCMEPYLRIDLQMQKTGAIEGEIFISPDHMEQTHRVKLHIDQSYLTNLLSQLKQVIGRFPMRGV